MFRHLLVAAILASFAGCLVSSQPQAGNIETVTPAANTSVAAIKKKEPELEAKVKLIPPSRETSPFLTNANFVMDWTIVGPFTFKETDFGGGMQVESIDKEFMSDEPNLDCKTSKPPEGFAWKRITGSGKNNPGEVNFKELLGEVDFDTVYCVCLLDVPADMDNVVLKLGCDDYAKIWINGKIVFVYNKERRASDWDQDIVKNISLKKGLNRIVVKCVNIVGGWNMYIRFTDSLGLPFKVEEGQ